MSSLAIAGKLLILVAILGALWLTAGAEWPLSLIPGWPDQ